MATKNSTRNAIIYINDEKARVTKAFEKKACVFGTEEFKLWREYLAFCPNAKMTTKSIKKNENQKRRRNKKYENTALRSWASRYILRLAAYMISSGVNPSRYMVG